MKIRELNNRPDENKREKTPNEIKKLFLRNGDGHKLEPISTIFLQTNGFTSHLALLSLYNETYLHDVHIYWCNNI